MKIYKAVYTISLLSFLLLAAGCNDSDFAGTSGVTAGKKKSNKDNHDDLDFDNKSSKKK